MSMAGEEPLVAAGQDERATLNGLSDPNSPAFERQEVTNIRARYWDLTDDLKSGTGQMRAAGERWLPREPRERVSKYSVRLNRSFLFNGYKDALTKTVARPFSRPVTIDNQDNLPDPIAELFDDADKRGTSLTGFAAILMQLALHRGAAGVIVEYPSLPEDATLADKARIKARPYFTAVDWRNILGWKLQIDEGGAVTLDEIRILDRIEENNGKFGAFQKWRVRVLRKDSWVNYTLLGERGKEYWELTSGGTYDIGGIPFIPAFLNRTGSMTAEPIFMDLAWLNLAHWQSSSDQRNILRFARTGVYWAKNFSKEEREAIVIGANQVIYSSGEDSDFKVVEYGGTSIKMGREDLEDLEAQMETLGLRPLVERTGNVTATATAVDESKSHTLVQSWIRTIENTITQALHLAAKFENIELSDDVRVNIFNDFAVGGANTDLVTLLNARAKREITRETFLRELKRRGVLSDDVDIADEIEMLEDEGPDLNEMGPGSFEEETDNDDQEEQEREDNSRGNA